MYVRITIVFKFNNLLMKKKKNLYHKTVLFGTTGSLSRKRHIHWNNIRKQSNWNPNSRKLLANDEKQLLSTGKTQLIFTLSVFYPKFEYLSKHNKRIIWPALLRMHFYRHKCKFTAVREEMSPVSASNSQEDFSGTSESGTVKHIPTVFVSL